MTQSHSFETDAQGNLVGVPTNLKVDRAGNVFDGAGNYVGRAGEVYVDNDGNAVNSAGQIVGYATAGQRAHVTEAPVVEQPVMDSPVVAYNLAQAAHEVLANQEFYRDSDGGLLQVPTDLTVDDDGMVRDAHGLVVGRAGEVFVDAHGNAINAAGEIVGAATASLSAIVHPQPEPLYEPEPAESYEQNDGTTFAEEPFITNATEGLLPNPNQDSQGW